MLHKTKTYTCIAQVYVFHVLPLQLTGIADSRNLRNFPAFIPFLFIKL